MTFEKGHEKYGGRDKGVKNKFTNLKNAFMQAFDEMGGAEALKTWAGGTNKSKQAFYQMISKMLPSNVTFGEDESNEIKVVISDKYTPKNDKDPNNT